MFTRRGSPGDENGNLDEDKRTDVQTNKLMSVAASQSQSETDLKLVLTSLDSAHRHIPGPATMNSDNGIRPLFCFPISQSCRLSQTL